MRAFFSRVNHDSLRDQTFGKAVDEANRTVREGFRPALKVVGFAHDLRVWCNPRTARATEHSQMNQ
jgi:hypothetical protein